MRLITRELVLRSDLGIHGNLFGGTMMCFLDKAAAIEATRLCQSNKMVTAEMEGVKFIRKVKRKTSKCGFMEKLIALELHPLS